MFDQFKTLWSALSGTITVLRSEITFRKGLEVMSTKQSYIEKVQARLNKWDAEIEKLKAQAANASGDALFTCQEQIDELKERQAEAQTRLDNMRDSGDDAWEDLKEGVEAAWGRLDKAVRDAASRFAT